MLKKVTIFLAPLVLVVAVFFLFLKNGIKLDNLTFSNVKLSQLYLKLDKKLIFTAKQIDVLNDDKEKDDSKFDPEIIRTVLKSLTLFENIRVDDISVSGEHIFLEFKNHLLSVKHGEGYLSVKFDLGDKNIIISVDSFIQRFASDLNATITVHKGKKDLFFTDPDVDIKAKFSKGDIVLNLDGKLHKDVLSYSISSNDINDIRPITQYLSLEPDIRELLDNRLRFSSLKISQLKGSQNIKELDNFNISSIDADVSVKDLSFKYEDYPKIAQKSIDLALKNNDLFINFKNDQKKDALSLNGTLKGTTKIKDIAFSGDIFYKDMILKSFVNYKNDKIELDISSNRFSSIKPIEDIVEFPKTIKKWIITRLDAEAFKINSFTGTIDPNNIKRSLSTLRFKLQIDGLELDFNPNRAYPLQGDIAYLDYDGTDLDITFDDSVRSNDVDLKGSNAVIYNMLSFNGDSGIKLNLQSISNVNETLVRVVSSYDIDILKSLELAQTKGKSDIVTIIDIPFSDKPIDVYVKLDTQNAVFSIKDNPIDFSNFDFEYKDKAVHIKDTAAHFQGVHADIKDILFDIKNEKLNVVVSTYDDNKSFAIDITDKADFKTGKLQGEFIINHVYIKDMLEVNYETLKYNGVVDRQKDLISFSVPALKIDYKKEKNDRTLVFNDILIFERFVKPLRDAKLSSSKLKVRTKDFNTIGVDLYLKGELKEKQNYQLAVNSLVDINSSQVKGELDIQALEFEDIFDIEKLKLPYSVNYKDGILAKLPSFGAEYKFQNDLHTIAITKLEKLEQLLKPLQKHEIVKGSVLATTKDFKNIKADLNIDFLEFDIFKYEVFSKEEKLDGMEFFVDISDLKTVEIKDKNNMLYSKINITEPLSIDLDIDGLGIVYKDSNTTKEEKSDTNTTECNYIDIDLPKINANFKNGYLTYNKHSLIYDELNFKAHDAYLDLSLDRNDTSFNFNIDKEKVAIKADMLDKVFINNLASTNIIDDGTLNLNLEGTQCILDGTIILTDVTVKDIAILNQVFLVINAAPAALNPFLILPSAYRLAADGAGLEAYQIKGGFMKINLNRFENILHIKETEMVSSHNDFKGTGDIYLTPGLIDAKVDVVFMKDFAKIMSYVPVVGYLILGDDESISYSVDIKGSYSDPQVSTHMVGETIMAPVNILKRIITYPARLIDKAVGDGSDNNRTNPDPDIIFRNEDME